MAELQTSDLVYGISGNDGFIIRFDPTTRSGDFINSLGPDDVGRGLAFDGNNLTPFYQARDSLKELSKASVEVADSMRWTVANVSSDGSGVNVNHSYSTSAIATEKYTIYGHAGYVFPSPCA